MEALLVLVIIAMIIVFVALPIAVLVKISNLESVIERLEGRILDMRRDRTSPASAPPDKMAGVPPGIQERALSDALSQAKAGADKTIFSWDGDSEIAELAKSGATPPAPVPVPPPETAAKTETKAAAAPMPEVSAKVEPQITPVPEVSAKIEPKPVPPPKTDAKPEPNWLSPIEAAAGRRLDSLEARTGYVLSLIWSWICVDEQFRRKDMSREYAAATTWLIRVGLLILLFGFGFFLKYSIDRNWINPAVRVIAMTVTGTAMVAGGVYGSSGKYRQLFVALTGGGFATLYLSIMAAHRLYALVPSGWAFGFMCLVTLASMVVSVRINAMLPALIACVAGYLTPVVIPTPHPDPVALFMYLGVLGAGTLVVSKYREWGLLHLLALALYCGIGGSAAALADQDNALPMLALLAGNYLIFAVQVLIRPDKKIVSILELILMTGNVAFFFGVAIPLAGKFGYDEIKLPAMVPLFTAAATFAGLVYARRKLKAGEYLPVFLLVITAFALAMTVPLLLSGVWTTAAWSLLALGFVYAAARLRSSSLLTMGALLFGVTFVRGMFAESVWNNPDYLGGLADHLLTAGTYSLSLLLAGVALLSARGRAAFGGKSAKTGNTGVGMQLGMILCWAAAIILFVYTSLELNDFTGRYAAWFGHGVLTLWWSTITAALAFCAAKYRMRMLLVSWIVILALAILSCFINTANAYPPVGSYGLRLLNHVLSIGVYIAALIFSGAVLRRAARTDGGTNMDPGQLRTLSQIAFWLGGAIFFAGSSAEVFDALRTYLPGFRAGGVSVWWGMMAFFMLFFGIKNRIKALRLTAIVIFVGCAVKIFLIDLAHLEQVWRIVAFIVIGLTMLIGAVIYIKFKDQFVEQGAEKK